MSNIINSQMNINNNSIVAKNLTDSSVQQRKIGVISAPESLPKYSINKVLQEKDEFRKTTISQNYIKSENSKKRKSNLLKLGFILSAVAGFFILKRKV